MEFQSSQASSRVVLCKGTPEERVYTACEQCRDTWMERNARGISGDPPCEDCRVELLPVNSAAAAIYQKIKSQVRLYYNGEATKELDLDHTALWLMIEHFPVKIADPWEMFEKINRTYQYFLRKREDNDN